MFPLPRCLLRPRDIAFPTQTTAERQYIVDKTHLDNPDPHSYSVPSQFDEGVAPVSKSFLTTAQR